MTHTTNSAEEASSVKSNSTSGGSYIRLSVTFVFAFVLSGGLFHAVLFTQSRFASIFSDYGVDLTFPTFFALSPWMLVVTGALFLLTVAKEFIGSQTRFVRLFNGCVCLATLILGFVYAVAMFLPLIHTGTSLD